MEKIKLKNEWYFESINDMIYTLKEAPVISGRDTDSNQSCDNGDWCDTKNYEEAEKCMLGGRIYDDIYKYTYKQLNKKQNNKKNKQNYGVQGYNVCVPLYLNGVPECMITSKKRINNKIYNIVYNCAASGYVSSETIMNTTKKVMKRVIDLEKRGIRVNLYVVQPWSEDKVYMVMLKIKSSNEKLNIKKICFPLCSSSFMRRIGFACAEKLFKEDITHSCYGTPINQHIYNMNDKEIKKMRKYIEKKIKTNKYELWDYEGNYDDKEEDKD